MKTVGMILLLMGGLFLAFPSSLQAKQDKVKVFSFSVFLEDKHIGQQRFTITTNGSRTDVQIVARFEVKYWLLTAYSYRHTNDETWVDDCLHMINAQTNDNGKTFFVRGTHADDRLKLVTHEGTRYENGCVKTYAYWNSDYLNSPFLLNSQTGEMDHVAVRSVGEETIMVRNQSTPAMRHTIRAEEFSIDVWYSPSGEWVALRSTTKDDSVLRYELQ